MAMGGTPDVIEVAHKSEPKESGIKEEAAGIQGPPEKPLDQPAPEEILALTGGNKVTAPQVPTNLPSPPLPGTPPRSQHSTLAAGSGTAENQLPKAAVDHQSQQSQSPKSVSARSSHTQQQQQQPQPTVDSKMNVQLAILDNQLRNILKSGREESQASTSVSERQSRPPKPSDSGVEVGGTRGLPTTTTQTNGPGGPLETACSDRQTVHPGVDNQAGDLYNADVNGFHSGDLQERRPSDEGVNVNGTLVLEPEEPEGGFQRPICIEDDNDNQIADMPKISMPDSEHDTGRRVVLGSAIEYAPPRNGSVAFGTVEERSQTNMLGEYVVTSFYVDENATRAAPYTLASQFNVSMASSEEDSEGEHKWEVITRPSPAMQSPAREADKRRSWHIGDDDKPSGSSSSEPRRHSVPKFLLCKEAQEEREKEEQEVKEVKEVKEDPHEDSDEKTQTQSVGEDYERTGTLKRRKKRKGKGSGKVFSPSSPMKALPLHEHQSGGTHDSVVSFQDERGTDPGHGLMARSSSGGHIRGHYLSNLSSDHRQSGAGIHSLRTETLTKRLSQQDLHKLSQELEQDHGLSREQSHSHIKDQPTTFCHSKEQTQTKEKSSFKTDSKLDEASTKAPEKDIECASPDEVLEFRLEVEREGGLLKAAAGPPTSDSDSLPPARAMDLKLGERGAADGESPRQIVEEDEVSGPDTRDGLTSGPVPQTHHERIALSIERLAESLSRSSIGGHTLIHKGSHMAHSTTWPTYHQSSQGAANSPRNTAKLNNESVQAGLDPDSSSSREREVHFPVDLEADRDSLADSMPRGSNRLDGSALERELRSLAVARIQPRVDDSLLRASFDMARLNEQLQQNRSTSPDVLRMPRPPANPAPHKATRATAARYVIVLP